MADRNILYKLLPLLQGQSIANAENIEADDTDFANIDQSFDNVQGGLSQLNRLFGVVQGLTPGTPSPGRFSGPFVPFTSSTTITGDNFNTFAGLTALYARSDNARVNFILPTDAIITAAGVGNDERVEFAVLNQAGTGRFDSGFTPTNTVIIDVVGANNIRRNTADGTLLNFIEAHQNDLVTLVQDGRGQPWVATRVTLSNAALLLPSGLFRLQVGTTVSLNPALGFIAGLPAGVQPQAGDAYLVRTGNDDFGGYGVSAGDVLVALQDNPNRQINVNNDDWLVLRNGTNDIITLQEIRFLNQIIEVDTFTDDRLIDRSDVTAVRVWLSPYILDHAPFINPSQDPDNPQSGETESYLGGEEDRTSGNEFGGVNSGLPQRLVYVDIDGGLTIGDVIDDIFLVIKDRDGNEVSRHNLAAEFRAITLTGSTDTYYVFDDVGATDNFSSVNYVQGQTIEIVERRTERSFNLGAAINLITALKDNSITISKLEPNAQALLQADHSLSATDRARLDGLTATANPTDWTAGELYVKDNDASSANDLSHYVNVDQLNGIIPNYERTRSITFLVPTFVVVTGLMKQEDNSQTLDVTPIGTILGRQAFTATLPAITGASSVLDNVWVVNGQAQNLELTGADNTFKVTRSNLADSLTQWIQSLIPTPGTQPTPFVLPEKLQQLNTALTVTDTTTTDWTAVEPHPFRTPITREYAAFWTENRVSATTPQVFEDLTGTEVLGYAGNHKFYYSDPNDRYNTAFPGAQSYWLNSNWRFRNVSGNTPIANTLRKIFGFDYALQAPLTDGSDLDMLRIGTTSSTALMGLHHEEGLYLNIGRGDGGQQSRTYSELLEVDGGHWHDQVDQVTAAEAEIIIPQSKTGSLTVQIDIQLDNNGNDEGTHEETVTITNVGADQNLGQRTWSFSGYPDITADLVYEHANNDLTPNPTRRVLFIRPTQPFTNAALTYNVAAYDRITETWNHSTTYARHPINVGDAHDDFGLFDPSNWNTEHVEERNRVLLMLQPYRLDDSESDPEVAAVVIVDGELHGANPIRLHRPASDFGFTDWSVGNFSCAVSHLQLYSYSGDPLTSAELLYAYNHAAEWLGAFYAPGHAAETLSFNANIEIGAGYGLILTDVDTSTRRVVEVASGALTNKDA